MTNLILALPSLRRFSENLRWKSTAPLLTGTRSVHSERCTGQIALDGVLWWRRHEGTSWREHGGARANADGARQAKGGRRNLGDPALSYRLTEVSFTVTDDPKEYAGVS